MKKVINTVVLSFALVSSLSAATITEDFSSNPAANGWLTSGDSSLFSWNSTNQNLDVTWDSSKTNSYFHHPLGTILNKEDDFSLSFDIRLNDITAGTSSGKPYTFQISVGLLNLSNATGTNFSRGAGIAPNGPVNIVDFSYFPDDPVFSFGATVFTACMSRSNEFSSGGFSFPFELTPNDLFHVTMTYTASSKTLATTMTKNGDPFGPLQDATVVAGFDDFRVDQVAVMSYSDEGQDPLFGGSVLAHGTVDNFVVVTPPPPVLMVKGGFEGGTWQTQFESRTNWLYSLERTDDFSSWSTVSPVVAGTGSALSLQDTNSAIPSAFFRVRADRP